MPPAFGETADTDQRRLLPLSLLRLPWKSDVLVLFCSSTSVLRTTKYYPTLLVTLKKCKIMHVFFALFLDLLMV